MNIALCVGIDYYAHVGKLDQCVEDAVTIAGVLETNGDDSPNFEVHTLVAADEDSAVLRSDLKRHVKMLFSRNVETALFYFSGHGASDEYGSYLCTSETREIEDGFSMETLMQIVGKSRARNKVIILDSCHSGQLANVTTMTNSCILPENTVILTACASDGVSYENVFTPLVVEALKGSAMNLEGEVNVNAIYTYVERIMSVFYQHPVFKANCDQSVCLRRNKPQLNLMELRRLMELFENPDDELYLDPSYEEDKHDVLDKTHYSEKEAIMRLLRLYQRFNLVEPVGTPYLYWAAINSMSCRLTTLGRYYWRLVNKKRI